MIGAGVIAGSRRRSAAPPVPPVSADWSDVRLLLSAEGQRIGYNGYGNLADSAVITARLTTAPTVTDTESPFPGGRSFQNFGPTATGIRVRGTPSRIYTGEFTLEGWARSNDWGSSSYTRPIVSAYTTSASSWEFRKNTAGLLELRYFDPDVVEHSHTAALPAVNTWFHWCLERNAADLVRLYIGGAVLVATAAAAFRDLAQAFWWIGATGDGSGSLNLFAGQMAEVRLTRKAVYNGAFTPPAGPFARGAAGLGDPHWSSVKLLSQDHVDIAGIAHTNSDFPDRSPSGIVFDAMGNEASVITNQRGGRLGDWSDTGSTFTTRRASGAQVDTLNFFDRTIPFTAEGFFRPDSTALSGDKNLFGFWNQTNHRQYLLQLSSGKPQLKLSTSGTSDINTLAASPTLVAGTWYHIALTRSAGATYHAWVDGVAALNKTDLTGTNLHNVAAGQGQFHWGGTHSASNSFTGQKHGLRVTHGVDRYPSAFTPPALDQFPAYAFAA